MPLPEIPEVKEELHVGPVYVLHPEKRPPVGVSLGPHLDGFACPRADPSDSRSNRDGLKYRMGRKPPVCSEVHKEGLYLFVERWLKKNLTPIPANTCVYSPEYIESINQSFLRKSELFKCHLDREGVPLLAAENPSRLSRLSVTECHCFPKAESYPDYKYPRTISARVDESKVAFGRFFKLIEGELYEGKIIPSNRRYEFIKHVPVPERPDYIEEKVGNSGPNVKYAATDYTSYEAHFTPEVMNRVEFQLYHYMCQYLEGFETFKQLLDVVIAGTNHLIYREFEAIIEGTRMSGETNTSLGNGFFNLMAFSYACKVSGARKLRGVIEGDDGLFSFEGNPPDADLFSDMGLIIKLDYHPDLHSASFCGIIYDPEDGANITEPLSVLVDTPFTSSQYASATDENLMKLLKAKAYSMAYQYPRCPILSVYAEYLLKMTADVSDDEVAKLLEGNGMSMWDKTTLAKAIGKAASTEIGENSRQLMEDKFHVTREAQIYIENLFRNKQDLLPINDSVVFDIIYDLHPVWHDYFVKYSMDVNRLSHELYYPPLAINVIREYSESPTRSEWSKIKRSVGCDAKYNPRLSPVYDMAAPEVDSDVLYFGSNFD